MKQITLGKSALLSSRLAYGCWRIAGDDPEAVTEDREAAGRRAVIAAYEAGYTLFDHADIYGRGHCERIFGQVLREVPGMRQRVAVATKCGVCPTGTPTPESPAHWDFSPMHIMTACEGSLRRLGVETIDLLMLHRPDYLANPEEVAETFHALQSSGKVQYFGLSNCRPSLFAAIQSACDFPLIAHQVEISLAYLDPFVDGTLDQCLMEKVAPLAWSPLAGGLLGEGASHLLPAQKKYRPEPVVRVLDGLASTYGISRPALAIAWLLKHPSGIVPIVGSTNPDRIRDAVKASEVELSRDDWYRLLEAARGEPLP